MTERNVFWLSVVIVGLIGLSFGCIVGRDFLAFQMCSANGFESGRVSGGRIVCSTETALPIAPISPESSKGVER